MEPDEIVRPSEQIREPGEPVPETDPEDDEESGARVPPSSAVAPGQASAHEGALEEEVGDRTGPRAGYDDEPEQQTAPGGRATGAEPLSPR